MPTFLAAALMCAGGVAGIFFCRGKPKSFPRWLYMVLAGCSFAVALLMGLYLALTFLLVNSIP